VALALPIIITAALVGTLVGLPFADTEGLFDGDQIETPLAMLVTSLFGQQLAQGAWPFVVSRWKGLGPVLDWKVQFRLIDLPIGLGTAIIAVGLSTVLGAVTAELVGLTDEADAGNTQFLVDAEGTVWLYFLLVGVVIGAPLAEELFFRGLVLRAFEKRGGPVVAVIGSTVVFTLPHFTGAGLDGTLVLFASIGGIGLVLAAVALTVNRLGPTIIAHALFNAIGAAAALGALDSFT
jgi:membrane protease YdiL (CAAX protease family)